MGRIYTLLGENLTLGTGSVLAAIQSAAAAAAGSFLSIRRVEVSQNHNTTAAQCRLALGFRTIAGTLTMTSATPSPVIAGGPASGIAGNTVLGTGTARCGVNSSADAGGTYTPYWNANFNNLNGFAWIALPDSKILVPPSSMFVAYFIAAPGDTAGWTVNVEFEELF